MSRERRHVLAITTDSTLIHSLAAPLAAAGYSVHVLPGMHTPTVRIFLQSVDAYLIDLESSNPHDAQALARLVQLSTCHGLALAGHDRPDQRIAALRAGVAAVVSRPVDAAEIIAWLDNVKASYPTARSPQVMFLAPGVVVDGESSVLACHDVLVSLTAQESSLLLALAQRANAIATHRRLCDTLGMPTDEAGIASLRQLVARLRRKLECDTSGSLRLVTQRHGGYSLTVREPRTATVPPGAAAPAPAPAMNIALPA